MAEQYKQLPKIKEAELQIRNLEIEQAKQSASFYKEFNKARYLISVYGRQKLKNEDLTKTYDEKLVMVQRLDSSKLIVKTELLKEMIENHKQKTDFLILEQKAVSSIEKIKFLTEQDDDTKRFCRI